MDFVILILIGVLVLIVCVPSGSKKESKRTLKTEQLDNTAEEQTMSEDDYKERLEEQLSKLIEKMDGAGRTKVMLTFADEGCSHVDKNQASDDKKKEQTTVVYDTKDGEQPYVIRRERPKVEGVVVVAEGAENPQVVTEISNAVMSLFRLEAHKIVVVKMSVQEE